MVGWESTLVPHDLMLRAEHPESRPAGLENGLQITCDTVYPQTNDPRGQCLVHAN